MNGATTMNKLKWYAEQYVALGLKVLPIWGIKQLNGRHVCACAKGEACDQKPGKHPLTWGPFKSGVHSATNDMQALGQVIDAHPDMNLAIAVPDGMIVIDVDPRNGGDYQLQDIETRHGKFPDTWDQITGGGGRHLCYQVPQGMKFANKLAPGIDIKQGGGYIMVEPSMHESGQEYGWEASSNPLDGISIEMAPPWLMQMSTRPTITSVSKAMATYSVDEVTVADLRAALLHVDPDDRDTWVRVGHALKTIGDVGLDIWDQWSQRSPKYKAEEIVYRWHGFAPHNITYKTVFHAAQECGWVNTAKRRSESATPEVTITYTESEAADLQSETRLPPSVPQHIIDSMPGVLKIAHEWMCKTAYRPLPEVLAISSISLIATAMGRIFSVDGKLRTNLMFVSAAGSGTGKEHGPTCVDTALSAAGCEGLVGGARIASSAGLITRLQRSPCTLYQIDEFGLRLQAMRAKNSGSHEKQIMVELMELATSAHKIYRGTDYAEVRDTQVQYPCLNLNATTTQAELFPAFSGADIVNGAINRMMIVFGPELADHGQRPAKVPVPKALVDWIKAVRTTVVPIQSGAELRGEDAWDVPVSPMAQKLFEALDALCVEKQADLQKAGMAPLWLRGGVFARQLADIRRLLL